MPEWILVGFAFDLAAFDGDAFDSVLGGLVQSEAREWDIDRESRMFGIDWEPRVLPIPIELRTFGIDYEPRVLLVPSELRTMVS